MAKTVLVVEDSEDHRWLATLQLRQGGYETATAHDGAAALAYLHTHALPDAILLDLRMPVMDGFEFLAAQQHEPELARIPVIIWSSEHHFRGARRFTRAVVCCVSKTDGREILLSAMRIALATEPEAAQQPRA
jgi:CheY-like chemotaxis protein